MLGKDRFNAAFWCGSSAIVRRTALEEVGGVDTRTVTEDMHTSMQMHARGWKSIYHDRELALGIAPDGASSFPVSACAGSRAPCKSCAWTTRSSSADSPSNSASPTSQAMVWDTRHQMYQMATPM